jgi:Domain of unknown function (DUF4265)
VQVKVRFQDDDNVETLWAEQVGPDEYRLDNSPFWAYGVSWRDVVEARRDAEGTLAFVRVVEKSGHRTVRLILDPPADRSPESQAVLDGLVPLGATYEGMHPGYLAIDVPPEVTLERVVAYLTATGRQWEHADPRYSDLYPDDE